MTMHLVHGRDRLSSRRLAVFLVLGVFLIIGGFSEGASLFFILVGAVVVVANGTILAKRVLRRHG